MQAKRGMIVYLVLEQGQWVIDKLPGLEDSQTIKEDIRLTVYSIKFN